MNTGNALAWKPGDDHRRISVIDAHTAGEPLRVILAGFPQPEGATILEQRRSARLHADHLRTALMWEPRGHADMYGCLIVPPASPGADFGVLFLHNEGYSTMCGHGIIAVATVAVETGLVEPGDSETRIVIDTPAGPVTAFVTGKPGAVSGVRFRNVPSFVVALDQHVTIEGIGRIRYDVAFGGAFYAFVNADDAGVLLDQAHTAELIGKGRAIKGALKNREFRHPDEADLGFLYGTIFTGPARTKGNHSRNVCIFADGEVDRSPTGTGVSARLALHFARGEIGRGEEIVIESIIGTTFAGRVVEETSAGSVAAIVPEVAGQAFITGRHEFFIDPRDPLRHGFLLR